MVAILESPCIGTEAASIVARSPRLTDTRLIDITVIILVVLANMYTKMEPVVMIAAAHWLLGWRVEETTVMWSVILDITLIGMEPVLLIAIFRLSQIL